MKIKEELTKYEILTLVKLICNEQTHMIMKDPSQYNSDKYQVLEKLKIKIKDYA